MTAKKRVFVITGRNVAARVAIERFVASLGLRALGFDEIAATMSNPMIARVAAARASAAGEDVDPGAEHSGTGVGVRFLSHVVQEGLRRAHVALVVFTPDEFVSLAPSLREPFDPHYDAERWQSRPTVSFASGVAVAAAPERTMLVAVGTVTIFPDVYGGDVLRLTNSTKSRSEFRRLLVEMGCDVAPGSEAWADPIRSGDFEACVAGAP